MLISVVIPCFNVQDYIEECIHSIITQTYQKIEIICIDNNSTDSTWGILQKIKEKNQKIIIEKEKNSGAPSARNKGLSIAKGDWIQFLDADDLLLPEKINHQVNLLENAEDSVFVVGACIRRIVGGEEKVVLPDSADIFSSLFFTRLGNTCSNLWKAEYLSRVGGWDELLKSSQETDLMFRLLQINQKVIFDNNPLTVIRERPSGQISQTNLDQKWHRYFLKRIEMIEWLKINKKKYFQKHEQVYKDGLFGILKNLASEDLNLAEELYSKYLGRKFKPGVGQEHSTKFYLAIFNLFGFRKAEAIRKMKN